MTWQLLQVFIGSGPPPHTWACTDFHRGCCGWAPRAGTASVFWTERQILPSHSENPTLTATTHTQKDTSPMCFTSVCERKRPTYSPSCCVGPTSATQPKTVKNGQLSQRVVIIRNSAGGMRCNATPPCCFSHTIVPWVAELYRTSGTEDKPTTVGNGNELCKMVLFQ